MQVAAFGLILAGTVVVALGLARLVLGVILSAMGGELPLGGLLVHWKRVATVGVLFWLAYLVPVIASSDSLQTPVAQLIRLLTP